MRFGYWISTEHPFDEVAAAAREAERLGYDAVYVADHFMPQAEPPLGPRLEAWTTLGALAACTSRVRLGVLVSGNTYRHPAVLAKMAATVDRISGGRALLGLGAGWQANEHTAYGIELPEVPELLGRLEEACQVIKSLFEKTWSDFDGRWYHLANAPLEPKPVQHPLPLILGVAGERVAMGIAARHAEVWNYWSTPKTMGHKLEVLDTHCERIGRDPSSLERTTQALVQLRDDEKEAARLRNEESRNSIAGTPTQLSEDLCAFAALGIAEFILPDRTLGKGHAERMELAARFLEEVAAPLRS